MTILDRIKNRTATFFNCPVPTVVVGSSPTLPANRFPMSYKSDGGIDDNTPVVSLELDHKQLNFYGPVAQLVERLFCNQEVVGSNPIVVHSHM